MYEIAGWFSEAARRVAAAETYGPGGLNADGCCPVGVMLGPPMGSNCYPAPTVDVMVKLYGKKIENAARTFFYDWDNHTIKDLAGALGV